MQSLDQVLKGAFVNLLLPNCISQYESTTVLIQIAVLLGYAFIDVIL